MCCEWCVAWMLQALEYQDCWYECPLGQILAWDSNVHAHVSLSDSHLATGKAVARSKPALSSAFVNEVYLDLHRKGQLISCPPQQRIWVELIWPVSSFVSNSFVQNQPKANALFIYSDAKLWIIIEKRKFRIEKCCFFFEIINNHQIFCRQSTFILTLFYRTKLDESPLYVCYRIRGSSSLVRRNSGLSLDYNP